MWRAEQGACRFAPRVAGMPSWGFRIIIVSVLLSLLSLIVIHKVPDDIGEGRGDAGGAAEGNAGQSSGAGAPKRGRLGIQRISGKAGGDAGPADAPRVEGEGDVFAAMAAQSVFSR